MMRKAFSLVLTLGLFGSAFLPSAFSQIPRFFSSTTGQPYSEQETADQLRQEKKEAMEAKWNIAVDVQMLALPQDLALLLLPDLQSSDASKVDAAVDQLQDLLKRNQAVLLGWPRTLAANGQYAVAETMVEKRFPSEFVPPTEPQTFGPARLPSRPPLSLNPNSMESRNVEISLEVTPRVRDNEGGFEILVNINVYRTIHLGFDYDELGRTKEGHFARIGQPKFATSKTKTTILMHSEKPAFIGVHMLASPEDHIELVIARAVATKTD